MSDSSGKTAMYEAWVREYSLDVYRCAARLCGNADCADELTQEVFFEAWKSIDRLKAPEKAKLWLMGILRHRYMHWLRDEKRRPRGDAVAQEQARNVVAGGDLPADVLAREESLQAALNALDDRYKVPFLLVFLDGMTCQQAADFLDLPLGTVLSRIHRGRAFMREQLSREQSGPSPMRITGESNVRGQSQPPAGAGGVT